MLIIVFGFGKRKIQFIWNKTKSVCIPNRVPQMSSVKESDFRVQPSFDIYWNFQVMYEIFK